MKNTHPFSIRIFVANGDPDGLRIIEGVSVEFKTCSNKLNRNVYETVCAL